MSHKKKLPLFLLILLILSCNSTPSNLVVKGEIKGLNKGKLYLQKFNDSAYVNIDSLTIKSSTHKFEFKTILNEPEILFLILDDYSYNKKAISFFAEKGIIEINTSLKHFEYDAKIKAGLLQKKLDEYNANIKRFNELNLELIKHRFEANTGKSNKSIDSINSLAKSISKRKYLYTINFALNNKNLEIAPYLATYQIPNVALNYLDTIYNSLPNPIANSKYGKTLNTLILKRKAELDAVKTRNKAANKYKEDKKINALEKK